MGLAFLSLLETTQINIILRRGAIIIIFSLSVIVPVPLFMFPLFVHNSDRIDVLQICYNLR